MHNIRKARSFSMSVRPGQRSRASHVPAAFTPPPGGYGFYGPSYNYQQVLNYTYWAYIAIKAHVKEIAGGKAIHLGTITDRPPEEAKRMKRYLGAIRKNLGGPQEHEQFDPYPKDHWCPQLFNNPNGPDVAYDLLAYDTIFFNLCGHSHWWLIKDRLRVPREAWVVPSQWTRLLCTFDGDPAAYEIRNPWGNVQYALYSDVISFYDHSPLNRWEGWAVTSAIAAWLDVYDSVVTTQLAMFKNGATPSFHVELDDSYSNPDEAMLRRYYAKWFGRFQGEANAGQAIITGPGVKLNPIGAVPNEIGFEASEEAIRNRVLAAYGVPQALVTGDPTVDTSAYAPQRTFCRFTINPILTYKSQVITEKLIKPVDRIGAGWWDDRVPDDPKQVAEDVRTRKDNQAITPNEVRILYGQDPYPYGGDDPFGPDGQELNWATGKQQQASAEERMEQAYKRQARALEGGTGSTGGYLIPGDPRVPKEVMRDLTRKAHERHHRNLNGKNGHHRVNGATLEM